MDRLVVCCLESRQAACKEKSARLLVPTCRPVEVHEGGLLLFIFDDTDKLGKDNSTVIVVLPLISLMVDQVKVSGVGLHVINFVHAYSNTCGPRAVN